MVVCGPGVKGTEVADPFPEGQPAVHVAVSNASFPNRDPASSGIAVACCLLIPRQQVAGQASHRGHIAPHAFQKPPAANEFSMTSRATQVGRRSSQQPIGYAGVRAASRRALVEVEEPARSNDVCWERIASGLAG
jgi:hypothetical protein